MSKLRWLLLPFSLVYAFITAIRNWFYDIRLFRSFPFNIPIINVGNLSMGGTGKTPHTEYLIRLLKDNHHLATLSRGYGRKTTGFILADNHSTAKEIGDEPLQYVKKFGKDIHVAVESNRVKGVMDICYQKEETDLILLDDAYQHRAIKAGFNILLTDYNHPFFNDFILPVGNLRESRKGKSRADVVIVTKCPEFEKVNKEYFNHKMKLNPNQNLFFSKIKYGQISPVLSHFEIDNESKNIILVTGIANPNPLLNQLQKSHQILHHFKFSDHYTFKETDIADIHNLLAKFADKQPIILTTEKDAMRFYGSPLEALIKNKPWFYQSIEIEIDDKLKFDQLILKYVQENRRDY